MTTEEIDLLRMVEDGKIMTICCEHDFNCEICELYIHNICDSENTKEKARKILEDNGLE